MPLTIVPTDSTKPLTRLFLLSLTRSLIRYHVSKPINSNKPIEIIHTQV